MNSHRFLAVGVVTVGLGLALGCGGGASGGSAPKQPEQSQQEPGGAEAATPGEQVEAEVSEAKSAPAGNYPAQEAGRRTEEKRTAEANIGFVLNREDGMAAGMVDKSWSFNEGRRTSVEKVNKGVITQFSVLYGKREGKGLENWTPLPTEAKPYTLKSPGEGLEIVDQSGKKITPEERTVISREYGWVGKPNPLLVLLARAKGGEAQNLDKDEITALTGFMPEMEVQSVRATPAGTEKKKDGREVTKLNVELEGVITSKDTKLALKMSGPALVDNKTGYVVDLALGGGIEVGGYYQVKERRLKASGKGKIKLGRSTKIF
jgi:hypothetical protein